MKNDDFPTLFPQVKSHIEQGYGITETLKKFKLNSRVFYHLCPKIDLSELQHISATHSLRPTQYLAELSPLSELNNSIIKIPFGDDVDFLGWL